MDTLRTRRWMAMAFIFCLSVPVARADVITPDSIANPPGSVGSANFTPIYSPGDLVTTQYKGLGLNFLSTGGSTTAITTLDDVKVWAPASPSGQLGLGPVWGPPLVFPVAGINYDGNWGGASFVQPGTLTPTTASSVTLEIIGRGVWVNFFNSSGGFLGSATIGGMGMHGGQLYTFTGSGIRSFSVYAPIIDPLPPGFAVPAVPINPAWGVAEVSFTPAHAPEPPSLILASLGAMGLAVRFGWRRVPLAA